MVEILQDCERDNGTHQLYIRAHDLTPWIGVGYQLVLNMLWKWCMPGDKHCQCHRGPGLEQLRESEATHPCFIDASRAPMKEEAIETSWCSSVGKECNSCTSVFQLSRQWQMKGGGGGAA